MNKEIKDILFGIIVLTVAIIVYKWLNDNYSTPCIDNNCSVQSTPIDFESKNNE